MQRTQLLSDLVELDNRIIAATAYAARSHTDVTFEKLITEVRALRQQRAVIQARLDALDC